MRIYFQPNLKAGLKWEKGARFDFPSLTTNKIRVWAKTEVYIEYQYFNVILLTEEADSEEDYFKIMCIDHSKQRTTGYWVQNNLTLLQVITAFSKTNRSLTMSHQASANTGIPDGLTLKRQSLWNLLRESQSIGLRNLPYCFNGWWTTNHLFQDSMEHHRQIIKM